MKCIRAQARWRDFQRFSVFIDRMVDDLRVIYDDPELDYETKVRRRDRVFDDSLERFRNEVAPTLESFTFGGFLNTPLNNATLLSRMRYYHRLPDFQRLLEEYGTLRDAVAYLADRAEAVDDPFRLLPAGAAGPVSTTGEVPGS